MSAARDSLRKGWCPGALRPMRSGDGLIARLRITGGIVPAALARGIAACARSFGNGWLDLSGRANLQVRGIGENSLGGLTARLGALGILDEDAAAEAVRNVMASPLAGLDSAALLDIRPVVAALEARLRGDRSLHALPGKFGFLVDDGGSLSPSDVAVDVRFEAFAVPGGVRFAVLAGGDTVGAQALTTCAPGEVPDVAANLASAFIRLSGPAAAGHRMAGLLARMDASALAGAAGLALDPVRPARPAPRPGRIAGALDAAGLPVLGVAAPFGAWSADALDALAALAEKDGLGELRLTPWRAILLPGVGRPRSLPHDLVVDPADPRLSVAACTGAPGCLSATTRTRDDALALAGVAHAISRAGIGVHVSGCAKGCAHPGVAAFTLVGREGVYDLVAGGTADADPIARGLAAEAVRDHIAALAGPGRGADTA